MRSEQELRLITSIADDLPCGVWVAATPDGRFVYSNRAFEEIMGMGPVDVGVGEYAVPYGIYGRDGALYPEHRMPFVRALEARATVIVDDLVIHRRDGRRVYVRATSKPITDDQGVIRYVAIAFFDITREAEAEEAQSRTEHRLRHIIVHAPVVLVAVDRDGKVTAIEGRGLEGLGTQADFVGKSVFDLYPEEPAIAAGARRALAGEANSYMAEVNGRVYESHLAPLSDARDAVVGYIVVSVDVTERHRMQAQLARAERLASLGMLAAGVAHEVNNPLAFILGNLELLQADLALLRETTPPDLLARIEERVGDMRTGAERVRATVGELRVFSRVDEKATRPVDVRAAAESALTMAQNEIRHRARLVRELGPVGKVMADEGRLCQVFLNLLLNAAQAIPEGDAAAHEIRVVLRAGPGSVELEVHDTGVGIAPDVLPRIFDPFFTTKPVGSGTGLGLAICHAIVTALGGRIVVESSRGSGRGTTARVMLPTVSAAVDEGTRGPGVARMLGKRGSVLVVDDEPLLVKMLTEILAQEHDVTSETSGVAALARLREGQRFDAIVCDLMMPQVTGMDLYDTLLEIAPGQARSVLFLTGGAFTPRARAFLERVSESTLEKPVRAGDLTARVRRIVG